MSNTIYFKMSGANGAEQIRSSTYAQLTTQLESYPNGLVGAEINADGMLQHFFYQRVLMEGSSVDIRRYPLRKSGEQFSIVPMYVVMKHRSGEYYLDTTPQLSSTASVRPKLPDEPSFISDNDKPTIEKLKNLERVQKLQPSETAPFFPSVNLTRRQQAFLYSGQVKTHISFQEELNKLLNDPDTSMENKELILKACISTRSFNLSHYEAEKASIMITEFLKSVRIGINNAALLCSDEMKGTENSSPMLGEIHNYYRQCIQSHLQTPVSQEELDSTAPEYASVPIDEILTRFPEWKDPAPYRPLSDKDEICLDALNLLLMSQGSENSSEKLRQRILDNPKFMEVLVDLIEMVNDLKDVVDFKRQTTSNPAYEMIYREFFAIHELNPDSLSQLPSLKSAYDALKPLQVIALSNKKLQALHSNPNDAESQRIRDQLKEALDNPSPEIQKQAMKLLFAYNLLSHDEKSALFAEFVAKGQQDAANEMLTNNPDAQKLLKIPSIFTDYSGRTFNCTAYEYAYWAKDTHMCRMLEGHMNDETKADIALRIKKMECIDDSTNEPVGLTYSQNGRDHHSTHFDLSALITALNEYVQGFDNWYRASNWTAIETAWMKVGLAQRDVPVHVINEYCRKDRSFDPCPEFKENKLPRELMFYNWNSRKEDLLFPLVISASSGLGLNFSLCREGEAGGGERWGLSWRARQRWIWRPLAA